MQAYIDALKKLVDTNAYEKQLPMIAEWILEILIRRGRVFVAGNGGSFSIAQHFANDLMWGPAHLRDPVRRRVICLGSNPAVLTALANDIGYGNIFAQEAQFHEMKPCDLAVTFSVSGTSHNIVELHEAAILKRAGIVAISGVNTDSPNEGNYSRLAVSPDIERTDPLYYYVCESVFSAIAHEIARMFHQKWVEQQ